MQTKYQSQDEIDYETHLKALRLEYARAKTPQDQKFIRAKVFLLKLCYRKFKDDLQ